MSDDVRVLIDKQLKMKFHKRCIEAGLDMSTVLRRAIEKFMKEGDDGGNRQQKSGKN
jgi:antitoxin component of RelBE/YafQ-DinJ toxin-antitoxin module